MTYIFFHQQSTCFREESHHRAIPYLERGTPQEPGNFAMAEISSHRKIVAISSLSAPCRGRRRQSPFIPCPSANASASARPLASDQTFSRERPCSSKPQAKSCNRRAATGSREGQQRSDQIDNKAGRVGRSRSDRVDLSGKTSRDCRHTAKAQRHRALRARSCIA